MNRYDYLILAFYFLFMIGVGTLFRKFSSDISDYFRGGGSMLWWMCGASSIMGGLSVWSFTGAASKIYEAGIIILTVYLGGIIGGTIIFFFTCRRFRQMRVITSVEAIRRRYGGVNEQFYVWLQVPIGIVYGGLGLNSVGVFISSVFGTDLVTTVAVVGLIVIFVASAGGVWAVVAGDFVQMLIMLLVASVAAFLALQLPEIGGLSGLVQKLPAAHFDWANLSRPGVVGFWISAMLLQSLLMANDLSTGAARFMAVKDGVHARRAALMSLSIGFVLPALIIIPPLAAVVLYPDLHAHFPALKNPGEAAYVAVCIKTMPHGLLGLMVSGIFAVAMANMDTGLNRNAGVFVKNFYSRVLRPRASEKELLLASRGFTVVFGAIIIGVGILIAMFRNLNLFDFVIALGSLMGIPLIVPMVWGLFIRRTPSWACWSTALIGFAVAAVTKWWIGPGLWAWIMGWDPATLKPAQVVDINFATTVWLVALIGSAWYFFTMRFADRAPAAYKREVDSFFKDMKTPVDPVAENIVYDDARQYRVIGRLCLLYGGVMLLGTLIPNPLHGRLCFVFVGGMMLLLGGVLTAAARRHQAREAQAAAIPQPVENR